MQGNREGVPESRGKGEKGTQLGRKAGTARMDLLLNLEEELLGPVLITHTCSMSPLDDYTMVAAPADQTPSLRCKKVAWS